MKIKVLNLYAGIGGNRKLWKNVDVTAVEIDPKIAKVYQKLFPEDQVIVADAHKYLLEHYKEFDFIWSSPPCPTHSVCNNFLNAQGVIRYPEMGLWQEIIFLKHFCKCKWVVENVRSYYDPLFKPQEAGRHFFWSNFKIPNKKIKCNFNIANMRASTRKTPEENLRSLELFHNIDINKFEIKDKRKLLRNCVHPELGLHVFKNAFRKPQKQLFPTKSEHQPKQSTRGK